MPVLHCHSNFEGTSYKKLQDLTTSSFISCCFTSADIIFYNFSELDSKLSKKYFCHKLSFFIGFTQTSHPLKWPKSANMTKVFLSTLF